MKNNKSYLTQNQAFFIKLPTSRAAHLAKCAFFHGIDQWLFEYNQGQKRRARTPKEYGGLSVKECGDGREYHLFKTETNAGIGGLLSPSAFHRLAKWRAKTAKNQGERELRLLTAAFVWVLSQLYENVNRPCIELKMRDFVRFLGLQATRPSRDVLLVVVGFWLNFAFNGDKKATLICKTETMRGGARVWLNAGVAQQVFEKKADLPCELFNEGARTLKGGIAVLRHLRLGKKTMRVADFQRESDGEINPRHNAKATMAIVAKRLKAIARALKINIVLPEEKTIAFFRGVLKFFASEAEALQSVLAGHLTPKQIAEHLKALEKAQAERLKALGLDLKPDKPPERQTAGKRIKSQKRRKVARYKRNFKVA